VTPRPQRRRAGRWAAATLLLLAGWARVGAANVDGYVELGVTDTEDKTQNAGFDPIESSSNRFLRRVNLQLSQQLFPNLILELGGFFENEDVRGESSAIGSVDADRNVLRPFIRVRLNTITLRGDAGFDRTDTRTWVGPFSSREQRDTWAGNLGWYPDNQNFIQLRYVHNDDTLAGFPDSRRTSAGTSVDSLARPTKWLAVQYRAFYDVQNDLTEGSRVESNADNLRLSFADAYWRSRLVIASDFNWSRLRSRQRSSSGDDFDVRIFPAAALSSIDDTPDRGPLAVNVALIDGDRAVGAGINLGLQTGDDRRRNFGFDLGVPQRMNVCFVWIDRELLPPQAQAFDWEIWTSDDNDVWTFRRALPSAPFGPFDDRFELAFEAVTARYVKVVVRPLSVTDPDANNFPVIQVTEIEAFERLPAGTTASEISRSQDRFTFNSRLRLLEREQFFYDLSYLRNDADDAGASVSLVNGLTYSKAFNPTWALTTRLANERSQNPGREDQNTNVLSATVSANPLDSLASSLFFGGRQETIEGTDRDTVNAVWTTTATLYRGVDVSASLGGSRIREETGRNTDARLINVSTVVSPHPALAFSATLQDNSRTESGGGLPDVEEPDRATEFSVTLNPVPTLYLFASHRIERRREFELEGDGRRSFDNYVVNWSPFPYGTLQLSFTWNETYDTLYDTTTKFWGPTVRWNIRPRWFFDVSYRNTENDSDLQRLDRREAFATLRISF
jgi:hypothetical protein